MKKPEKKKPKKKKAGGQPRGMRRKQAAGASKRTADPVELSLFSDEPGPRGPSPDPRMMERSLWNMGRILEDQGFASLEEMNAYLEQFQGGEIPAQPPRTPLEEAQLLVFDAWETSSGSKRLRLARKALEISPDCADAYVILAEKEEDEQEALKLYRKGARAGERALGPEVLESKETHFWAELQTRPYMRCLDGQAECLEELDRYGAAEKIYRRLLGLNPDDNQGIRYKLAACLLTSGKHRALGKHLDRHEEDSTFWAYTRLLWSYQTRGEGTRTDSCLERALEVNPLVPQYLLGAKEDLPASPRDRVYGLEFEAIFYVAETGPYWLAEVDTLSWLATTLARMKALELAKAATSRA